MGEREGRIAGPWTVANGVITVNKESATSRRSGGSTTISCTSSGASPRTSPAQGQARGNSGLFLASTGPGDAGYELQILDSYNNNTYVNGQAASIYKQAIPLANAMRKPGEWQMYDIV